MRSLERISRNWMQVCHNSSLTESNENQLSGVQPLRSRKLLDDDAKSTIKAMEGQCWSEHTIGSLLTAVALLKSWQLGKKDHAWVLKDGICLPPFISCALIYGYVKLQKCENVFVRFREYASETTGFLDVVILVSMFEAYSTLAGVDLGESRLRTSAYETLNAVVRRSIDDTDPIRSLFLRVFACRNAIGYTEAKLAIGALVLRNITTANGGDFISGDELMNVAAFAAHYLDFQFFQKFFLRFAPYPLVSSLGELCSFDWLYGLLTSWGISQKETKILFLDLDNSGKTTLLHMLRDEKLLQHRPILHPPLEELSVGNINFRAFDLGGHRMVRRVWKAYCAEVDYVVFLVEANDRESFAASKMDPHVLLYEAAFSNIPLLVLGNKIDLTNAASAEDLHFHIGLEGLKFKEFVAFLSVCRSRASVQQKVDVAASDAAPSRVEMREVSDERLFIVAPDGVHKVSKAIVQRICQEYEVKIIKARPVKVEDMAQTKEILEVVTLERLLAKQSHSICYVGVGTSGCMHVEMMKPLIVKKIIIVGCTINILLVAGFVLLHGKMGGDLRKIHTVGWTIIAFILATVGNRWLSCHDAFPSCSLRTRNL